MLYHDNKDVVVDRAEPDGLRFYALPSCIQPCAEVTALIDASGALWG